MQLVQHCIVNAPIERLFDLVRSIGAHEATSSIDGRAVAGKTLGLAALNDVTTWSARFFGFRFQISTRVTNFNPPFSLTENLERGLLLEFGHVYSLRILESGLVELEDRFTFRSPLGAWFDALMFKPIMTRTMSARLNGLKELAETEGWKRFLNSRSEP
jgi:hypothetical protein